MQDTKNVKLGDSFFNIKDNRWYYFDGTNWILPLVFEYKNWSGKKSERTVLPVSTFYGITEYHKTPQWFLRCMDLNKKEYRDFAIKDILTVF